MNLLSLNAWGGRAGTSLIDFVKSKSTEIDVFCFQEIFNGGQYEEAEVNENIADKQYDLFSKLQGALPEHTGFFEPCLGNWYGQATFVRRSIPVSGKDFHFVHGAPYIIPQGDLGHHSRLILDVILTINSQELHIINFHGLWNGKGKTDSEERIKQSTEIVRYLKHLNGKTVLCGDFNLLPNTESIALIEATGLINLIAKFGVTSTRTPRYTKPDKFADYIFTSPAIRINHFSVLPDNVSDHAPLLLQFTDR